MSEETYSFEELQRDYLASRKRTTEECMALFLTALRAGATTTKGAARHARLSPRLVYDWIRRGDAGQEPYAQFLSDYMHALQDKQRTYLELMEKAARDPNHWRAAHCLLERIEKRIDHIDPIEQAHNEATEAEVIDVFAKDPRIIRRVQELAAAGELPKLGDGDSE